jgi:hypothetical protein
MHDDIPAALRGPQAEHPDHRSAALGRALGELLTGPTEPGELAVQLRKVTARLEQDWQHEICVRCHQPTNQDTPVRTYQGRVGDIVRYACPDCAPHLAETVIL